MICKNLLELELTSDANWEQIESSYRNLIKKWHPDRFLTNPTKRELAEEKTKNLNIAFDNLKKSSAYKAITSKEESQIIKNKKYKRKRRLTFYREFKPHQAIITHEHFQRINQINDLAENRLETKYKKVANQLTRKISSYYKNIYGYAPIMNDYLRYFLS